jgi:hypothetical protein
MGGTARWTCVMTEHARPCAGCPWLAQSQTKAAVEASPLDGRGMRWFDPRNLRERWTFCAEEGGLMPCHATDRNAHLYGGERAAACDTGRVCVGLTVLAKREVHHFMKCGGNYARYSAESGQRMTLKGLAMWAARLLYPGAVLDIGEEQLAIPDVDMEQPDVTVPWRDNVLKRKRKRSA